MKMHTSKKFNGTLNIYTDGASRDNPGHSSYAYIFVDKSNQILMKKSGYIGIATNNVAEYTAVIKALNHAMEYTRENVVLYSDSMLVINQINGVFRVKKEHLKDLLKRVMELKSFFKNIEFYHVPRENKFIKICDELCNDMLNKKLGKY